MENTQAATSLNTQNDLIGGLSGLTTPPDFNVQFKRLNSAMIRTKQPSPKSKMSPKDSNYFVMEVNGQMFQKNLGVQNQQISVS